MSPPMDTVTGWKQRLDRRVADGESFKRKANDYYASILDNKDMRNISLLSEYGRVLRELVDRYHQSGNFLTTAENTLQSLENELSDRVSELNS